MEFESEFVWQRSYTVEWTFEDDFFTAVVSVDVDGWFVFNIGTRTRRTEIMASYETLAEAKEAAESVMVEIVQGWLGA